MTILTEGEKDSPSGRARHKTHRVKMTTLRRYIKMW